MGLPKRPAKSKLTTQSLLDFDLGESSSDSDFLPDIGSASDEDGSDVSKDDDADTKSDNDDSDDEESSSDDSDAEDTGNECQKSKGGQTEGLHVLLKDFEGKNNPSKIDTKPICCVCLGDRSDDSNEIIECDGCGVSVHEGCYGVSDTISLSSTNSTCSTECWFCEACRAGVSDPVCELCPNNKGGIYKETDVGKWVHLICALYVPGVAFGEVDQLSSVTLFEMPYSKWGAKVCSLCEDPRFARTGVCIGCDAGMCKTYFHVTCAQAAGFLIEAHHEEAEAADPFYAHCKVHSEKEMLKKRKRNYHTLRLNMEQKQNEKSMVKLDKTCPVQLRIQRKLLKFQQKYGMHKQLKAAPWVPTQKMSRLLTTSASACRRLLAKAQTMAVDVELLERQEAQIAALTDIRKKWHIPPAFSVEFIGYYLDRISRAKELKQQLVEMIESNNSLSKIQDTLRKEYDQNLEKNKELKAQQEVLLSSVTELQGHITTLCPNKSLINPSNIGKSVQQEPPKSVTPPSRPISVPTAAALKMGVGFPLAHLGPPGTKVDSTRLLSTHAKNSPTAGSIESGPSTPTLAVQTYDCGICKLFTDQHLLAKCDTCMNHYHLGCLNPPLTRHPKKSKLYGWQCSECDKSDESDALTQLPKGPRKSRTRFNKDGTIAENNLTKELSVEKTKLNDSSEMSNGINQSEPAQESAMELDLTVIKKSGSPDKMKLTASDSLEPNEIPQKQETPVQKCPKDESQTSEPTEPGMEAALDVAKVNELAAGEVEKAEPIGVQPTQTAPLLDESLELNKSSRKQKRKDKHKSRHNTSSDMEKSPSKEHKRKRKKRMHEESNPLESDGIPKIKIKFKYLPKPGEETPEAKFFYVSADTVRSAAETSRPTSVETVEETSPQVKEEPTIPIAVSTNTPQSASKTSKKGKRNSSPRKAAERKSIGRPRSQASQSSQLPVVLTCCVCNENGTTANIVKCDSCPKHYHFGCLDPPVKKTPKIRGYSWHCADCDNTDEEIK